MATKYLDSNGLLYLWQKIKDKFSLIGHTHTKSEITDFPTIPTKTSDLTNDSNFVSDSSYVHTDNNYTTAEKNKLSGIATGAEKNRTYTAVTGEPTEKQTPSFGDTFTISQITQSTTGQITATDRTVKIPNAVATYIAPGLMSAADKEFLDESVVVSEAKLAAGDTSVTVTPPNNYTYAFPVNVSAINNSTKEDLLVDSILNQDVVTASIASAENYDIMVRVFWYLIS